VTTVPARLAIYALGVALLAAGCASAPRYTSKPSTRKRPAATRKAPSRPAPKKGNMRVRPGMVEAGVASFYGPDFHGKTTANGEVYDMYGRTAAHKTLPLNTIIRVTNLANSRNIIVRINDRGPFVKGRILDLSYGAALKLGFVAKGTTRVRIEIIEVGDDQYIKRLPNTP